MDEDCKGFENCVQCCNDLFVFFNEFFKLYEFQKQSKSPFNEEEYKKRHQLLFEYINDYPIDSQHRNVTKIKNLFVERKIKEVKDYHQTI